MVDHQSCKVTSGLNGYLLTPKSKFQINYLQYLAMHFSIISHHYKFYCANGIFCYLNTNINFALYLPIMTDIQKISVLHFILYISYYAFYLSFAVCYQFGDHLSVLQGSPGGDIICHKDKYYANE